jgi:hypothetical protein
MHRRDAPRMSPRMSGGSPDASSPPRTPRTREPTACQAPATHLLCGYADRPPTGGRGFDLRRAADVLIHPLNGAFVAVAPHAVARGHRASDRTLCAPNGVLRGLVKVCQANLRGWGIVSVLSGQSEAQCGGVVARWAHLWKQRLCAVCFKREVLVQWRLIYRTLHNA